MMHDLSCNCQRKGMHEKIEKKNHYSICTKQPLNILKFSPHLGALPSHLTGKQCRVNPDSQEYVTMDSLADTIKKVRTWEKTDSAVPGEMSISGTALSVKSYCI